MLTEVSIHDFLWNGGQVVDADLRRHDGTSEAGTSMDSSLGIRRGSSAFAEDDARGDWSLRHRR